MGFKKKEIVIDGIRTAMYEPIPEEIELVKKVFEMYADVNYSNEDIAKMARNMPPECRRSRTIKRARIQDFIKNPIYVKADLDVYNFYKSHGAKIINPPEDFIGTNGCYLYTGDSNTRKQTDLSNAVIVVAPHEGFIESDLWIRCRQRALDQQQIKRNPKAKNTWLAGLVKCGYCGYALVRKDYKNKAVNYFLCSHKMNDSLCCGCGTIHADEFEKLILQKIKQRLYDFKQFELKLPNRSNPKIEELKARELAIDNEINEIVKGVIGANETVMAYINQNVEKLHNEKLLVKAEIQQLSENRYSASEQVICDFDKFDELPFERKRELACAVIKKIYATSDKIDIIWNI
jgi:hypothetical protein